MRNPPTITKPLTSRTKLLNYTSMPIQHFLLIGKEEKIIKEMYVSWPVPTWFSSYKKTKIYISSNLHKASLIVVQALLNYTLNAN